MSDNAPKVCQERPTQIGVQLNPLKIQGRPEIPSFVAMLERRAFMRKRNLRQVEFCAGIQYEMFQCSLLKRE
jgi:hypothetical protein